MPTSQDTPHVGLILRAVLDEPILQPSSWHPGHMGDDQCPVSWVLPLDDVLNHPVGDLRGIIVHAGSSPLQPETAVRLVARGACAVVLDHPLEETLAAATSAQLAVIESSVDFHRLNRLVAEKTLTQRAHVLEYGMNVHRELSEVLYRGAGLPAMTRQVSKLSGSPTYLLDTQLNALAYESLFAPPTVDPSEVLRTLRQMIEAGKLAHADDGSGELTCVVTVTLEQGPSTCVVCPIMLGGTTYGWVVIIELSYPPRSHDLAQHRAILEHGVSIIGAEMLRLRSVSEAEERARGDFAHALLHGRYADPHELATRATFHDFDTTGRYAVLVVQGAADAGTTIGLERQRNLASWIRSLARMGGLRTMAAVVGDLLCVIREVSRADGSTTIGSQDEEVAAFAHELNRDLRARTNAQIQMAYGRSGTGAHGIATSYREARMALALTTHLGLGRIAGYGELRVYAVIAEVADSPTGQAFAAEVLAPLRAPGAGSDLQEVVLAYIAAGGNLNAVARTLNLHRNTVQYKINRASRLLAMDIHDAENQFAVWLASRIDLLSRLQRQVKS